MGEGTEFIQKKEEAGESQGNKGGTNRDFY